MATAASIITDCTTCSICREEFDNPKSLPCIHAFCLKCLQSYCKDKCPRDEVPCPLCRKEFEIPPDGLTSLQHHFFIQHLIDARRVSSKSANEVPCAACVEVQGGNEGDIRDATVYCIDCSENLCEICSRHHRRNSMRGGSHRVKPLGAALEQELIKLREIFCDKHPDEKVKLYCHECDENICLMCSAVKHKPHSSVEIPDVAKSFSDQTDSDDQQVWVQIQSIRDTAQHKEQKRGDFLGLLNKMETDIKESGNKIIKLVNGQVAEQLKQVDIVRSDDTKKSDMIDEKHQLETISRESFHTYSRELLEKGRPSDITRAACELHKRATELLADDVTSVQYSPTHVTFTPVDVTHLGNINLVGQVTAAGDGQTDHVLNRSSVPIDCELKQAAETGKALREEVRRLEEKVKEKGEIQVQLESQLKQKTELLRKESETNMQLAKQLADSRQSAETLQSKLNGLQQAPAFPGSPGTPGTESFTESVYYSDVDRIKVPAFGRGVSPYQLGVNATVDLAREFRPHISPATGVCRPYSPLRKRSGDTGPTGGCTSVSPGQISQEARAFRQPPTKE